MIGDLSIDTNMKWNEMRRFQGHLNGERYCADLSGMIVHDLDFEKPECRIQSILESGTEKSFDSLLEAVIHQFAPCPFCTSVPIKRTKLRSSTSGEQ